jgi:hypothetical protein
MKMCPKCKIEKSFSDFGISQSRKDGMSCWCKECSRADTRRIRSSAEGAEAHRQRENARYKHNPDPIKERAKKWRDNNLDRAKLANRSADKRRRTCPVWRAWETIRQRDWYARNPAKGVAKTRRRQTIENGATPSWLDAIQKAQILEKYDIAVALNMQTGRKWHVDHVHALQGNGFRGLHVPWNLCVIPASENCSKGNKFPKLDSHMLWGNI